VLYLDNNATTRPAPEVIAAMLEATEHFWGNPSSVHRFGQEARARVELARRSVAELVGARPKEITFTGGGTEAIDLALRGALTPTGKRVLATTPVEHNAVRDLARWLTEKDGVETRWLPVDGRGIVDLAGAAPLIDAAVGVVSVQWANNETGAVQPVAQIARLCWERGVVFHCDATQWVGKMPTRVEGTEAQRHTGTEGEGGQDALFAGDLLSFSPHKFHGPKGVGVLWCRRGIKITPTVHGTQELGRRGGTENVPGIVGAGAAADLAAAWLARTDERRRLAGVRDRFEARVLALVPEARVNGPTDPAARLWNTANIGFPRLEAEALLLVMSEAGLCASAGAACSSGSLDPSPVLLAMGVEPAIAHGSVRFSISRDTTTEEVDRAAEVVAASVHRVRSSMT
jgi:cysteine desulfurase